LSLASIFKRLHAGANAQRLSLDGELTICVNLVALPALGRRGFL